ncbi:MAG TPA: hypothetical protein PK720_02560 [bacterium]|nr:hypothetical protein [bacterium]
MSQPNYWQLNKEISKELNNFLVTFCKNKPEFTDIQGYYCNKRTHLNGMQFYAGFIAGIGKNWQKYIAVPVTIELIMIWAYKTNQIIDNKKEVWESKENIKTTILQHDLLLVLIFELLSSLKKILKSDFVFFDSLVKEMMSAMTRGFNIERKDLNIYFTPLSRILEHWEKKYSKRNINFNLVYDYAPLIGYWLATGDKEIFTRYNDFFKSKKRFSEVGQIINDIGDWSDLYDESTRIYQDRFADIRNGILTFPIYGAIDNIFIKEAIANPSVISKISWQKNIQLLRNEIAQNVKVIGKKCFTDLVTFWDHNNKSKNHLVIETYLLLKHNKYLNL